MNKKNNGIKYEYTLSSNATIADSFTWKLGDWAACSATCGGGTQHRNAVCYQTDKGITFREMNHQTYSLIIIIIYLEIQELWMMKIAGQMRTTLNRAINFANVMRIRVRLIGGLVHGNCVRSRVESTVR